MTKVATCHVHVMERACLAALLVACVSSAALAACPPASCHCKDTELATCVRTDAANCSVLCLQGNYTAEEPLVLYRSLSVISDGPGSVTCCGGEAFLSVKDADYVELRGLVVKNCFQAVELKNVTRVRIIATTFRLVVR